MPSRHYWKSKYVPGRTWTQHTSKAANRPSRAGRQMGKTLTFKSLSAQPYSLKNARWLQKDAFPLRKTVAMAYSAIHTMTAPAATGAFGAEQTYLLNSIFDPDLTGVGHQPTYRDTYNTLYARYKVLGCYVTMTWTNVNMGAGCALTGIKVDTVADTDALTGGTYNVIAEYPNVSTQFINDTGSQQRTKKFYVPIFKTMNMTKQQYNSNTEDTNALMGANPAKVIRLRFAVADPNGIGGNVLCAIRLNYVVQLYDRIYPGQS